MASRAPFSPPLADAANAPLEASAANASEKNDAALKTDQALKEELRGSGLRYVNDSIPGISRRLVGKKFRYYYPDGKPLQDTAEIARINALAIPPAYRDIWICPFKNGHLQATGRDARGRKQYRYHPRWRLLRDENKYEHTIAFGYALPKIRRRVQRDLQKPLLSRENMLATIVRLLELTLIRIGNEEYVRANKSFGLTTLRNRHVHIRGGRLLSKFRGKSGQSHEIALNDAQLARVIKRCRDLPGQELFRYKDEGGELHTLTSSDVNAYLREITGEDFTAKDFRTWAGTALAAATLCQGEHRPGDNDEKKTERDINKIIVEAVKTVARQLGNTPAICKKCYIHPRVISAYLEGSLRTHFDNSSNPQPSASSALRGLTRHERSLIRFLECRESEHRAKQIDIQKT